MERKFRSPRQYEYVVHIEVFNSLNSQKNSDTLVEYHSVKLSNSICKIINSYFFSTTVENFTESLVHNSCLNRKILIDADGNKGNNKLKDELHIKFMAF